ncbi:MAG: hypothetical protein D6B25_16315 [Desulfobulbaceae bacterium]|nr:MAG: hypothetical protein D6B25_16315 [Desulfobulbaceae bacterium]
MDILLIIIFTLGFFYYSFRKYSSDRLKTFRNYIEVDLEKHGFKYVSSIYFKDRNVEFNDLNEDVSINPMGGKHTIYQRNVIRHVRKVEFGDSKNNLCEALAAIEFKSEKSKTIFKRVRWKPNLKQFHDT